METRPEGRVKREHAPRVARVDLASMETRPEGRVKESNPWHPRRRKRSFNGDAPRRTREASPVDHRSSGSRFASMEARPEGRVKQRPRCVRAIDSDASMETRPEGRVKIDRGRGAGGRVAASMETRPEGRVKSADSGRMRRTRTRFNGDAPRRTREVIERHRVPLLRRASMETRPEGRVKWIARGGRAAWS